YEGGTPPPRDQIQRSADSMIASQGRMKARQGRVAEGEADQRRALVSRLKTTGKVNLSTLTYVSRLANLLTHQGRDAEAAQRTRRRIESEKTMGVPKDAQTNASNLGLLASILDLQRRWPEAAEVYAELEEATKNWDSTRRETLLFTTAYITTLYN